MLTAFTLSNFNASYLDTTVLMERQLQTKSSIVHLKLGGNKLNVLINFSSYMFSVSIMYLNIKDSKELSHYIQECVHIPSLSSQLSVSFPKTVYHKHKSGAAWAHYGQPRCNAMYCQVLPHRLGLPLLSSLPSIQKQKHKGVGGGINVLLRGLHDVILWHGRGQSNPEKIMSPFVEPSIQSYRSAVNWELHRGHPPQRFVFMCMCVKKKTEEKRSGGGRQAEKCIVDMLMLLSISRALKMSWRSSYKTSARGPSILFSYFILYLCCLP